MKKVIIFGAVILACNTYGMRLSDSQLGGVFGNYNHLDRSMGGYSSMSYLQPPTYSQSQSMNSWTSVLRDGIYNWQKSQYLGLQAQYPDKYKTPADVIFWKGPFSSSGK